MPKLLLAKKARNILWVKIPRYGDRKAYENFGVKHNFPWVAFEAIAKRAQRLTASKVKAQSSIGRAKKTG
ncbi:MAG: hypothetical protein ACR9NN_22950 [Nostochopsis sp.]